MAARSIDDNAELAFTHAMAARRHATRVGVVREAVGVAAYQAGRYEDALRELRAARRMTGVADHLPMMADCERGLNRPRRALDLADDPAVRTLDNQGRAEMLMVAAGARRDLGDVETATAMLQVPDLRSNEPWASRLRYAYADALAEAGRTQDAKVWFERAAETDVDYQTDAADRAQELD